VIKRREPGDPGWVPGWTNGGDDAFGEEFFRAVFEQSAIGVAVVELDGRPVVANAALERLLGYTAEELTRLTYHAITYADDLALDAELAIQLAEGAIDHYVVEKRYVRKDSRIVWGKLTVSLLRSSSGEPQFVLAMVEDITDRKRVETALRNSEERFRGAFDKAGVGMALVALNGELLKVNDALCQFLGYPGAILLGREFRELTQSDDLEAAVEHFRLKAEGERRPYQAEKPFAHASSRTVWGHVTVALVRDATGAPRYLIVQVQDITARKLAEIALQDSESRYRGLVELAPDGVIVHCEGRIVFVNEKAARLFGAEHPAGLIGQPVVQLVHPEDRELFERRVRKLRSGAKTCPPAAERLVRTDGTLFDAEIAAAAVTHEGRPAVQAVIRDATVPAER
jgi:PAS domain S-box-containing protein